MFIIKNGFRSGVKRFGQRLGLATGLILHLHGTSGPLKLETHMKEIPARLLIGHKNYKLQKIVSRVILRAKTADLLVVLACKGMIK